jgi:hypothetical protein
MLRRLPHANNLVTDLDRRDTIDLCDGKVIPPALGQETLALSQVPEFRTDKLQRSSRRQTSRACLG